MQSEEGGPIKIGISIKPKKRLQACQTGSPVKLRLIALIEGNVENKLHGKFSKDHIHGEWYKPSKELIEFIKTESRKKSNLVANNEILDLNLKLEGQPVRVQDAISQLSNIEDGWFDHVIENDDDVVDNANTYFWKLYKENNWHMGWQDDRESKEFKKFVEMLEADEWHPCSQTGDLLPEYEDLDDGLYNDHQLYTDTEIIEDFFLLYVWDEKFIQKIGINLENMYICFMCGPRTTKANKMALDRLAEFAWRFRFTPNPVKWFIFATFYENDKQVCVNLEKLAEDNAG